MRLACTCGFLWEPVGSCGYLWEEFWGNCRNVLLPNGWAVFATLLLPHGLPGPEGHAGGLAALQWPPRARPLNLVWVPVAMNKTVALKRLFDCFLNQACIHSNPSDVSPPSLASRHHWPGGLSPPGVHMLFHFDFTTHAKNMCPVPSLHSVAPSVLLTDPKST